MNRPADGSPVPVAQLICLIVKERPGIHFRGLGRAANISSTGQLRHHIDRLGRRGALIEVEDGRFRRYFLAGEHGARIRQGLARFARPVPSMIARTLIDGALNRTEIRRRLGCADSTLGYHLRRMVRMGDLTRTPTTTCCLYRLSDPEFTREILQHQDSMARSRQNKDLMAARTSGAASFKSSSYWPIHGPPVDNSASKEPSASAWV